MLTLKIREVTHLVQVLLQAGGRASQWPHLLLPCAELFSNVLEKGGKH